MKVTNKRLLLVFGIMTVGVIAFTQLQYLIWSTASIANNSAKVLEWVEIVVDDAVVNTGRIDEGKSKFVILPNRGDATLSLRFRVAGRQYEGCGEYVEGSMYNVRVTIDRHLEVHCEASLAGL